MLRDRFSRPLSAAALALSESTEEDVHLLAVDLWGSAAHATMLGRTGLVPPRVSRRIVRGLVAIGDDAVAGRFVLDRGLEDVHLNVEQELTRRIGRDGERLHTGRSRNDQVATDLALFERESLLEVEEAVGELVEVLIDAARGPMGRRVVAGWTHLQPAQAVYVGQLLATHAQRFARDLERLATVRAHLALSPLGSGAIAGSSLPIDRTLTAALLGFAAPNPSSIDATSDRDVVSEALFALTVVHQHAGQLAEELVLGAMPEVARVRLDDAFVTSSSLMPHKRNPDIAELIRAESGPATGRLVAHLTVLKGLPLGYQRDLQAVKPILVEALERARRVLAALAPMVASAEFLPGPESSLLSTTSVEWADALVLKGVPFREAHARVARFVAELERTSTPLAGASASDRSRAFPELAPAEFPSRSLAEEPEHRSSAGGSAWGSVARLIAGVDRALQGHRVEVRAERRRLAACRRRIGIPERWFRTGTSADVRSRPVPRRGRGRRARSPSRRRGSPSR